MNQYLSDKIRNLSAVSILMVLYIHMYYAEGTNMPTLSILESFIGTGICSVAVPLFYIISGYLFFLKVPDGLNSIKKKIQKRGRTLLVPYLITNILTFLFYVCLNISAIYIPAIDSVVNFKVLDIVLGEGIWATFKLIFINPPIAFQLWFVRNLMIAVIFTPALWIIIRNFSNTKTKRMIFLICLFGLFILLGHNSYWAALIWFTVGGLIAETKTDFEAQHLNAISLSIPLILYICISIYCSYTKGTESLMRYIPLFGIPTLWYGYDFVPQFFQTRYIQLFVKYTFFIYLVHEPLLNIFKKLPLLISRSEPMMIVYYFSIPIIFYNFACAFGLILKKSMPKFYAIYTGGR